MCGADVVRGKKDRLAGGLFGCKGLGCLLLFLLADHHRRCDGADTDGCAANRRQNHRRGIVVGIFIGAELAGGKTVEVYREDCDPELIFAAELIGVQVFEDGRLLGKITQVLDYPGNKVYVVKGEHEYMIPAVKAFVLDTDMANETMQVKTIEGMRTDES